MFSVSPDLPVARGCRRSERLEKHRELRKQQQQQGKQQSPCLLSAGHDHTQTRVLLAPSCSVLCRNLEGVPVTLNLNHKRYPQRLELAMPIVSPKVAQNQMFLEYKSTALFIQIRATSRPSRIPSRYFLSLEERSWCCHWLRPQQPGL